jgi:hypothetical protein
MADTRKWMADGLIALGGLGLLTGIGGKYYFLFPVWKTPSGSWGDSFFTGDTPGVWTGDEAGQGTGSGSLYAHPTGAIQTALWLMAGTLEAQTLGVSSLSYTNYFGWDTDTAETEAQKNANVKVGGSDTGYGPLGLYAGQVMAGALVAGLFLRVTMSL